MLRNDIIFRQVFTEQQFCACTSKMIQPFKGPESHRRGGSERIIYKHISFWLFRKSSSAYNFRELFSFISFENFPTSSMSKGFDK